MYQPVWGWPVIKISFFIRDVGNVLRAGTLALKHVGVIRHRKMSALAPLHVVIESSTKWNILYVTKLVLYWDIGKCLNLIKILSSDRNRCVISSLYVHVSYSLVCVSRLVHKYVVRRSPSTTDGNWFISIPSFNLFCWYSMHFYWMTILYFWEFLCFPVAEWIMRVTTSAPIFSDVAQIQLICLVCSLISKIIALQRALLMMRLNLTGVFLSSNMYFHLWASVRI